MKTKFSLLRSRAQIVKFLLVLTGIATIPLPLHAQTVNSNWIGDGSANYSNGNWSNAMLWNPNSVPNNAGSTFYDVTIPWDPNGAQFNGPLLDVNATIRNLTLVNRAFIVDDS